MRGPSREVIVIAIVVAALCGGIAGAKAGAKHIGPDIVAFEVTFNDGRVETYPGRDCAPEGAFITIYGPGSPRNSLVLGNVAMVKPVLREATP